MTNFPNVDENFIEMSKTLSDFLGIDSEFVHFGETILKKGHESVNCNIEYLKPFEVELKSSNVNVMHWFETGNDDKDTKQPMSVCVIEFKNDGLNIVKRDLRLKVYRNMGKVYDTDLFYWGNDTENNGVQIKVNNSKIEINLQLSNDELIRISIVKDDTEYKLCIRKHKVGVPSVVLEDSDYPIEKVREILHGDNYKSVMEQSIEEIKTKFLELYYSLCGSFSMFAQIFNDEPVRTSVKPMVQPDCSGKGRKHRVLEQNNGCFML